MGSDHDTKAQRRAVVHMVSLAQRAEHEELDDEARAALDEATRVLDAHRRSVERKAEQAQLKYLLERVLVPVYEHVQAHPKMTETEVEARLVEEARACGFELPREALDDLVLLEDEITGPGAVKAASDALGAAVNRSGRTILTWKSKLKALAPNMTTRSGVRAANMLLHVAGLLRLEAAEQGRDRVVARLTSVIEFILGKPTVAPPPLTGEGLYVPPDGEDEPK
jgi:hypothetical protein